MSLGNLSRSSYRRRLLVLSKDQEKMHEVGLGDSSGKGMGLEMLPLKRFNEYAASKLEINFAMKRQLEIYHTGRDSV